MSESDPLSLPDAARKNWVDAYAPASVRPWLRLGRFDRPAGIWLLFLPGMMGLLYGARTPSWELAYKLVLFLIGAALMRAAGCAYNDIVDRDIDLKVARTRLRPIPSGQISVKQAAAFIVACSLISFLILIQLGTTAIWLGFASLGLVAAYPFMKRITWWPQAWLGLTFNWGFPMGYAAITGHITVAAMIFYSGLIFWTIGYDTIYALQDREDDALIGVKSSARIMGDKVHLGVGICYAIAVALTGLSAYLGGLSPLFYIGLAGVAVHLWRLVATLDTADGAGALKRFKASGLTGLIWAIAIILGHQGV
ncbi:MAG: 4-hydroxybenzoate octaprenyltransferase [Asticcacaulis sp.]